MMRVPVKPELLRWARERSQRDPVYLDAKFPKLPAWEAGEVQPTLKQVESFARATYTPVGYFFLSEPPEERLPIPDFRTMPGERRAPSPNLLDMIYACQQRQEWYRTYARTMGEEPLPFVDSATTDDDPVRVAADIREALGFDVAQRANQPTWSEALRLFISQADAAGILVMMSGIVLNDTHRALDPEEFRGFALSDPLAPLVFINGADTKAAQMFTLAHELAHIWLGESALSDAQALRTSDHEVELWCNRVAAETLVPLSGLRDRYNPGAELWEEANRLARQFKVSTLVVLRRIHDAGGLSRDEFWAAYGIELNRIRAMDREGGDGGNFYWTEGARMGKRFARALISSALEGQTTFTEAFGLLGVKKMSTFDELGRRLGVVI